MTVIAEQMIEMTRQRAGLPFGGLTTMIHLLADTLGGPCRCASRLARLATSPPPPDLPDGQCAKAVLVDKAYDGNDLRDRIARRNASAVIFSKRKREVAIAYDAGTCKHRYQIERCFGRFEYFRRFATPLRPPHPSFHRRHPSRRRDDLATLDVDPAPAPIDIQGFDLAACFRDPATPFPSPGT